MLHLEPSLKNKVLPSMYLTITGGSTGIIPRLLEQGGASSYFVGAEVPYSAELTEFIFSSMQVYPDKLCSAETALTLARYSKYRLNYLYKPGLGIGVTCSLMKVEGERPERINEAYVCFCLNGSERTYHWTFSKENYIEETDSLIGGYEVKVTRKYQEEQLVNKLYKTLVEILANA
jgi:hypothetical protein